MELRGRWALVTGAARRVGRVIALELARRGANIVVHYNTSSDDAEARSGGIALLVNSASNYLRTPFDGMTEAAWDASLDVNLKAPFLLAWTLGRAMRARGEGVIVNVADWAGERPYKNYLPYCISK